MDHHERALRKTICDYYPEAESKRVEVRLETGDRRWVVTRAEQVGSAHLESDDVVDCLEDSNCTAVVMGVMELITEE